MEKAEVLMWDFKKVLTEVYEVKSFFNWLCAQAVINSSVFGMNGFMSEAFENLSEMLVICCRVCIFTTV